MIYRLGLLAVFAVSHFAACSTRRLPDELKRRIQDTLAREPGVFAVAFKDLSTGEEILINERETFHAASTMKVPVMIGLYRLALAGRFTMSDPVLVKNSFKSIVDSSTYSLDSTDDSDKELYKAIGTHRSMQELIYSMITRSSNLATNMLIALADGRNVTKAMRELGAKDIQVLRGVEDDKAFQKGLNNTTTAYDLMVIFEKIAEGKAITGVSPEQSADASQAMIAILLKQEFNEIIPARLPTGTRVAHKTGEISGVRHDAGIVFMPDGRKYVLVLLSKQLKDTAEGAKAMAAVSGMIWQYMEESR